MSTPESERVDAYLDTVRRMEPDIAMVDLAAAAASIAISLKRIADAMTPQQPPIIAFDGPLTPKQVEALKALKRQMEEIMADPPEQGEKSFLGARRARSRFNL